MGVAAAPTRLPCGNAGRRSGFDPARAAQELRRGAAEAAAVPGPEGGVLPLGFRARRHCAGRLVDRSRKGARRAATPTRRVAVPPAFEPALSDDTRASRTARGRSRLRDPTHGRAARLCEVARAAVGDRSRAFRRRAEPDRLLGSRRLGRRNDEPRGGRTRRAGLYDVRRPARRRRRAADPRRPAAPPHRPTCPRPAQARGRRRARPARPAGDARPAALAGRPYRALRPVPGTDR